MDNKTKINKGQETHYVSVCTKFEEVILIQRAINAEQGHFLCPLHTPLTGDKIIVTLGYLGKMSPVTRDGYK